MDTASFFQKCWDVAKTDILMKVEKMLNEGNLKSEINENIITLTSKVTSPSRIEVFRQIVQCNW